MLKSTERVSLIKLLKHSLNSLLAKLDSGQQAGENKYILLNSWGGEGAAGGGGRNIWKWYRCQPNKYHRKYPIPKMTLTPFLAICVFFLR